MIDLDDIKQHGSPDFLAANAALLGLDGASKGKEAGLVNHGTRNASQGPGKTFEARRNKYNKGEHNQSALAREYCVNPSTISRIVRQLNRREKHGK